MITCVLFDLDGVLIDAKDIHYEALNKALEDYSKTPYGMIHGVGPISREDHLSKFDGLPTMMKLRMLGVKGDDAIVQIADQKQKYTAELIKKTPINHALSQLFHALYYGILDSGSEENLGFGQEYNIGVCSNSIRATVKHALEALDIGEFVTLTVSNQDVSHPKPHPEMYWDAMAHFGALPEQTLIIEDSPKGLLAAERSGAHVMRVKDPSEVNIENVRNEIEMINNGEKKKLKWRSRRLNVVIPMAGAGSRFAAAGYTFPKPLIDVNNKPMIHHVVDNLGIEANYIFIVQKEHREKYNLDTLLRNIAPNCRVLEVSCLTDGSARTALLAAGFIDNEDPVFFANSDQHVEWDPSDFFYKMQETKVDGGIVTFKATHPKWSFAKVVDGKVTEVAEKNPISDDATVGLYYWKHGSDFVKYARQMIDKDIRTNNEFYLCPVFNEAIEDGKVISNYPIEEMYGLGTPEDLQNFMFKTVGGK